ncbi:hypothetical protein [Streptomyces sp. NPDC097619]|uniref:hypothetical protein n=1 Tax=Streptomyces sp. NPDC097619 TaxID=3157228 RepID=UPI0033235A8D
MIMTAFPDDLIALRRAATRLYNRMLDDPRLAVEASGELALYGLDARRHPYWKGRRPTLAELVALDRAAADGPDGIRSRPAHSRPPDHGSGSR